MSENSNFPPAFLELANDHRLETLRKNSEVLFDGRLCNEKDGGFNRLTNLPPLNTLKRLNDLECETLSINIQNRSWIVNRSSGWKECSCYLSPLQGVLFIYYKKENRGFALKLSQAKKIKFAMYKNGHRNRSVAVDHCLVKLKWKFGSLRIYLNKNQIFKWQQMLVDAFNGVESHRTLPPSNDTMPSSLQFSSPSRASVSETSSIYSIKTNCESTPPAMSDSIDLINSDTCTSYDLDTTLTADSINMKNVQLPCSVVDSVDLLLQVPVPKTFHLNSAIIVDSEELISRQCSVSVETIEGYPTTSSPEATKAKMIGHRTVAEKIAYYKSLDRRPGNEKHIKHSITMRKPC